MHHGKYPSMLNVVGIGRVLFCRVPRSPHSRLLRRCVPAPPPSCPVGTRFPVPQRKSQTEGHVRPPQAGHDDRVLTLYVRKWFPCCWVRTYFCHNVSNNDRFCDRRVVETRTSWSCPSRCQKEPLFRQFGQFQEVVRTLAADWCSGQTTQQHQTRVSYGLGQIVPWSIEMCQPFFVHDQGFFLTTKCLL